jgi:hypothetical protein
MIDVHLDAVASLLNFGAAVFLALDALSAQRRSLIREGTEKFLKGLKSIGETGAVVDQAGNPLKDAQSFEKWLNGRTTKIARIGFGLLLAGFGLDLYSKLIWNPLLFKK